MTDHCFDPCPDGRAWGPYQPGDIVYNGVVIRKSWEGPAYADRVNGKLTFRDWKHWPSEDLEKYRDDPRLRAILDAS